MTLCKMHGGKIKMTEEAITIVSGCATEISTGTARLGYHVFIH